MRVAAFLLLTIVFVASSFAAETRPNIVVFITDDQSQLDGEPYGSKEVRTPKMTRLASEGMKFTHAFVASPACGPSRTALLTGLWPARNGAEPNHMPKRAGVASLPPVLRALGYEVGAIGKVAHNTYAKDHGFDFIEGPNPGFSETSAVAKFLTTRDRSKPLCLFVGTRHPHAPWSANDGYDPAALTLPPTHVDTPVTRTQRAQYVTDVTKADTLLGEVRALVREKIPGDTLFVYTSDHGAQWPFAKWTLYDAGIRVPLIIVWPGRIKPGVTNDALVCWPDLLPTFIELVGGQVPSGLDGQSFAGILRGTTTTHRERVFTTHSGDGDYNVYPSRSVRTRDWKYIRNLHPEFQRHSHVTRVDSDTVGNVYWKTWLAAARTSPAAAAIVGRFTEQPAEELYDLTVDPHEQHNLAADSRHVDRLASLRAELTAWMKQQGDQGTVFGQPIRSGEPVTLFTRPAGTAKGNKAKQPQK